MNKGFTITIGLKVGDEDMPTKMTRDFIVDVYDLVGYLNAELYSRPGVALETERYTQHGIWQDDRGNTVMERNAVFTGEIKEVRLPALRKGLRTLARKYRQDAIALAIHDGAELIG